MITEAALRNAFDEHTASRFPRLGEGHPELSDAQVDLADMDGYIAGLVMSYLRHREMPVSVIRYDRALPRTLAAAGDDPVVDGRRRYHERLRELGTMLSYLTGVPIEEFDRSTLTPPE